MKQGSCLSRESGLYSPSVRAIPCSTRVFLVLHPYRPFPLAQAHMELRAAELAIRDASWRYDQSLPCGEAANTAKYLAAEAGYHAADQAVQTLGGMGYASEYHVERYWREARLMRLAPVSQELVQAYIAANVLGLPKSY